VTTDRFLHLECFRDSDGGGAFFTHCAQGYLIDA
jgi:hypothetical protein